MFVNPTCLVRMMDVDQHLWRDWIPYSNGLFKYRMNYSEDDLAKLNVQKMNCSGIMTSNVYGDFICDRVSIYDKQYLELQLKSLFQF